MLLVILELSGELPCGSVRMPDDAEALCRVTVLREDDTKTFVENMEKNGEMVFMMSVFHFFSVSSLQSVNLNGQTSRGQIILPICCEPCYY
ncbi:MAG: hypothetical protein A2X58_12750 [Nitrospirae bacterium GWC2_56_14]|nr:MAG: hypothetical protein A2X58_12750 [Nitrospirae bacterium GWC2_56_14]